MSTITRGRTANITYQPTTDDVYRWNVGLYDTEAPRDHCADYDQGYVQSVGARDHAEAIAIADQWVHYRADHWTVHRVS